MSDGGEPGGDKGRTVGGRYRLLERIGSGGMGTVWRAKDETVDREVAVKQPHLPGDPEDESHRRAAHRLYREARAAARVDHPAAVSIHDVVVEEDGAAGPDGLPWIVMELVRGESLHEVLRRGPLEPAEAARIGLAVLGALRAAHAVGIVHRDVKPANVLLGPRGRVVLTDFGIAHLHGEESLTDRDERVGDLEFVAPERMSGRGAAGPASDLWSLGALLYTAVEGRSPFRRTTPASTLAAILAADPPEPRQAGPLGPLLIRLLVRDPDERPGPAEVAETLGAMSRPATPETVPEAVTEGRPATPFPVAGEGTAGDEPPDVGRGRESGADAAGGVAAGPHVEARAGEDVDAGRAGTVRPGAPGDAGGAPRPGAPGDAGEAPRPKPAPGTGPRRSPAPLATPGTEPQDPRSLLRRRASLTLLAAALAGGAWLGTSLLWGPDSGAVTDGTATPSPVPSAPSARSAPTAPSAPAPSPSPTRTSWTAHREPGMDAVLSLPSQYRESARRGGAGEQPRQVAYSAGSVAVRLTQWDRAPASPTGRAAQAHETWDGYAGDARTRTTPTSFRGYEAVLVDTTYGADASPTRVMELFVVTDDRRMYELRVDMPQGTPDEEQGTAVFQAARDRLRIGTP
ncbi:protein kinase [Streptomyces sp. NPDC014995]|uniref:serine/threonine-protein kinase n=1 Tax=Streptomyces sp. NPDC014995 TaxID=3364936 RepID=UPI0036FBAF81